MKLPAMLGRRGVIAGACLCVFLPWGEASRLRGDGHAGPAPLAGPLLPPPPDCLPKDPPAPLLRIKVRVPACAAPGQEIRYHVCVENTSPAEAHHVVVKNALPANARFVRADPAPAQQEPELQWQLGTIGAGACREIVLVLQPTNQDDIKNCIRVSFEHGECVVTRQAALPPGVAAPEPVPARPGVVPMPPSPGPGTKPPVARPVPPIVDVDGARLTLAMEGHKQQYVNLPSRYFLTVTNTGKVRATTVLLAATLPEKAKFISAGDKGQNVGQQVAWFLGPLEPGARRTLELVLGATEPGQWCVKAETLADKNVRAQAEFCTEFLGVAALTVGLTDRDDPIIVGARTRYTIPISNPGSAAVDNVQLKVLVPPGLKLIRTEPEATKTETVPTGQRLEFAPLKVDAGTQRTYEITVEALRGAGEHRLRIEVSADQLERDRPIVEEENTSVFDEADMLKR